ncbi:MAG: nucleotidyltransferase family protein [Chloroflexaceae bacterium]|nr:nucleotidyltransferase family protein [Chloroflexaceae bacterium]
MSAPQRHPIRDQLAQIIADNADQTCQQLTPAQWHHLVRAAKGHGLLPLLYHRLQRAGNLSLLPSHLQLILRTGYYHTASRNTLLYRDLHDLLSAWSYTSIPPPVLIKGVVLAQTGYPQIALRPMNDIDLLVPSEHVLAALRVMQSINYRLFLVSHHLVLGSTHPPRTHVDLHWSLFYRDTQGDPPPLAWFWQQVQPFTLSAASSHASTCHAQQLSTTAHVLYLIAHLGIQHEGRHARLLWFYDLHLLLSQQQHPIDWDALLDRAATWGWSAMLADILTLTHQTFATTLPLWVLPALHRAAYTEDGVRRHTAIRVGGVIDVLRALSWSQRLVLLPTLLLPSPVYIRSRYPTRWPWLWPLAYPYCWADLAYDMVRAGSAKRRRVEASAR